MHISLTLRLQSGSSAGFGTLSSPLRAFEAKEGNVISPCRVSNFRKTFSEMFSRSLPECLSPISTDVYLFLSHISTYLLEALHEHLAVEPRQPVEGGVEVDEVEALVHVVVVLQLLDLVVGHVQPEEGLGHEGVVEPLQPVVGDVEPLKLELRSQEAVDVIQLVAVEAKGLQRRIRDQGRIKTRNCSRNLVAEPTA